jgi:hypothetical protein
MSDKELRSGWVRRKENHETQWTLRKIKII